MLSKDFWFYTDCWIYQHFFIFNFSDAIKFQVYMIQVEQCSLILNYNIPTFISKRPIFDSSANFGCEPNEKCKRHLKYCNKISN